MIPSVPVSNSPYNFSTNGAVYAIAKDTTNTYVAGSFTEVGPTTGAGVIINASTGTYAGTYPKVQGEVYGSISDGSGGWYVYGNFTYVGNIARKYLAHINSNGTLDSSWGPDPDNVVQAAYLSGSTLYIAGLFTKVGGVTRNYAASVNVSGYGAVTSWNPNLGNWANTILVYGSTVYVGGIFTSVNGGTTRNRLAAFDNSVGTVTSFNPNIANSVHDLEVSSDGSTLYIAGEFTTVNGATTRNRIAALSTSTGIATAWNPSASAMVLDIQRVGTVLYAGGAFTTIGGATRNYLAALDTTVNTNNATAWNPAPNGSLRAWASIASNYKTSTSSGVFSLYATANSVFVSGVFTSIGGQSRQYIAEVSASTGNATSWNPGASRPFIASVTSDATNVYVGGYFNALSGAERNYVAAFDNVTGAVTSFAPGTFNGTVNAMVVSGSVVYVGGNFTSIGGTTRRGVAALDATTGALQSFNPNISLGDVYCLAISGTTLYVGGQFDTVNGATSRNNIAAFSTTTGTATAWNPDSNNYVHKMVISGTTMYVGGDFTSIGGQTRNRIARLDLTTNTNNADSWNPNITNGGVRAMALSGTKLYVGGTFNTVNGSTSRQYIAGLDTTVNAGTADTFNPIPSGSSASIKAIAVSGSVVYFGGVFSSLISASSTSEKRYRDNAAAVRANTASTTSTDDILDWDPQFDSDVEAILVSGSQVYVTGQFNRYQKWGLGEFRRSVAVFTNASPTIGFDQATLSANESDTSQTLTVQLFEDTGSSGSVNYAVTGGTATGGGTDFTLASGTATVTSGNIKTTIPLTIVNDSEAESTETIIITLSNPTGGFSLGISTLTFRIFDNDPLTFNTTPTGLTNNALPSPNDLVYDMKIVGNTTYIGGVFTYLGPHTGYGVPVSPSTGIKNSTFPLVNNEVTASVPDGNGGWYIGGWFTSVGGYTHNRVAHINSSGAVDNTWNPDIDDAVFAMALDGTTLYIGGRFHTVNSTARNYAAAISTVDGSVTAWDPNMSYRVNSIVTTASSVIVGGQFWAVNGGTTRNALAAFNKTNGTVTSWDPDVDSDVMAMALSGNTLYIGGYFGSVNGGTTRNAVAAIDVTTGIATSFNPNVNDVVYAMTLSGTTLFIGGQFTTVNGGTSRNMFAALDTTVAAGTASSLDLAIDFVTDGFDYPAVNSLLVNSGTLYIGGKFNRVLGQTRSNAAAITISSGAITSWDPSVQQDSGGGQYVNTLAYSGSSVYVGGYFTGVNAVERRGLAAIDNTTGQLTSWNPGLTNNFCCAYVDEMLISGNTMYVAGQFTGVGGQTRNNIGAIDLTTGLATAFNPNADAQVWALAISGSTIYAGGVFSNIGGQARSGLAALDATTGVATSFNPNPQSGGVREIEISGTTLYIALQSGVTHIAGVARSYVAAIDTLTGNVTGWNPQVNGQVLSIAFDGGYVYLGGYFGIVNGENRQRVAKVDATTGALDSWKINWLPGSGVYEMLFDGNYLYLGGDFYYTQGSNTYQGLIQIDKTTGNIGAWNPNLSVNDGGFAEVWTLEPGSLYVGGSFGANSSQSQYSFVKYSSAPTIEFSAPTASGSETVTAPTLTVSLSENAGSDTTVDYAVTGGSATGGGVDYILASGTATIASGNNSVSVPFTVINDSANETDETIVVTLSNPVNASLGTNTSITYTIQDNDAVTPGGGSSGSGGGGPSVGPTPPVGGFSIVINNGELTTNNPNVQVGLVYGNDTTHFALSNSEDFTGSVLTPIANSTAWNVCSPQSNCANGIYKVFAKFYSSGGVPSSTVNDTIGLGVVDSQQVSQVSTPVIFPGTGSQGQPVNVVIATSTEGAVIRFTTDGSEPNDSSTIYTGPFVINTDTVVKVKAYKEGLTPSSIVTSIITFGTVPEPETQNPVTPVSVNVPVQVPNVCGEQKNTIIDQYNQKVFEANSQYNTLLADAKSTYDSEIAAALVIRNTQIAAAEAKYKQAIADAESKLNNAKVAYRKALSDANLLLNQTRKQINETYAAETKLARDVRTATIKLADDEFNSGIQLAKTELGKILAEIAESDKKNSAKGKNKDLNLQKINQEKNKLAKDQYNAKVEELRGIRLAKRKTAEETYQASIKAAQDKRTKARTDATTIYNQNIANAKAVYNQALGQYKFDINQAKENRTKEIAAARAAYLEALAQAKAKYDTTVNDAKKQLDSTKTELANWRDAEIAKIEKSCLVDNGNGNTNNSGGSNVSPPQAPNNIGAIQASVEEENSGIVTIALKKIEYFWEGTLLKIKELPGSNPNLPAYSLIALLALVPLAGLRRRIFPIDPDGLSVVTTGADVWLVMGRTIQDLLGFIGINKKRNFWGTVYDSQTKQPLDPVIVKLIDVVTGKVVDQAITDLSGRYGFLIQPGRYVIKAEKTNYGFPSVKVGPTQTTDSIYENLYHGEVLEVREGSEVVAPNIPMDPLAFDWNQQDKLSRVKYHPKLWEFTRLLINFLFWFGFVFSIYATIVSPVGYNYFVVGVYFGVIVIQALFPKQRLWGRVVSESGRSVSGVYMELHPIGFDQVTLGRSVTAPDGKFLLKAPKEGLYHWVIKTGKDGFRIKDLKVHTADGGVVNVDTAI